nr:psychosine receptor-like [Biomphalaria glabrata]
MSNNTAMTELAAPIIDPFIANTFRIVCLLFVAEVVGVCGIMTNVINILVFRGQGYQDGVNITLTALAVSDIGALISQQIYNLLLIPMIQETDLVILKSHLGVLVIYVNEYFVRVSSLVTSFASVERCVCVVMPLKVKSIITRKVVFTVNVTIFLVLSLYLFPPYFSIYLGLKIIPGWNRTVLSIFYQSYGESVLRLSYNFTDLLLPYGTFLILILSSATIFFQLKAKAKWRHSISSESLQSGKSVAPFKERKSVVMLMTVSIVCVLLVLPKSLMLTVGGVVREMKMDGAYKDITTIVYSFTSLLETINSSITIFIYYRMSTKYRTEFQKFFSVFKK